MSESNGRSESPTAQLSACQVRFLVAEVLETEVTGHVRMHID
jgi:hypothetical protein